MAPTNEFISDIAGKLACGQPALSVALSDWVQKLSDICNDFELPLSNYDTQDASPLYVPESGKTWTCRLLEFSRQNGKPQYIQTGDSKLDFSLLVMELGLSIPANKNLFGSGHSKIAPDGLGIRRDGTICVVENKGPKDANKTVSQAVLQSLCGAVGIYAKRESLLKSLHNGFGKRPKFPNAIVPSDAPSIALYVMIAADKFMGYNSAGVNDNLELPKLLQLLIDSWPPLREIVLFSVKEPNQIESANIPYKAAFGDRWPNPPEIILL